MTKVPKFADHEVYDGLPSGAPMKRCPERSSKVDPRQIALSAGYIAMPKDIRGEYSAITVESIVGKQDFVPNGGPEIVDVNIQQC